MRVDSLINRLDFTVTLCSNLVPWKNATWDGVRVALSAKKCRPCPRQNVFDDMATNVVLLLLSLFCHGLVVVVGWTLSRLRTAVAVFDDDSPLLLHEVVSMRLLVRTAFLLAAVLQVLEIWSVLWITIPLGMAVLGVAKCIIWKEKQIVSAFCLSLRKLEYVFVTRHLSS